MGRGNSALAISRPHENECTGTLLKEIGKVFSGRQRSMLDNIFIAKRFPGNRTCYFNGGTVVNDGGITRPQFEVQFATTGNRHATTDLFTAFPQRIAHTLVERAQGRLDRRIGWYHVGGGAPLDRPDGDHCRLQWINEKRNNLLQRHDRMGSRDDRIPRMMPNGSVPTATHEACLKFILGSHDRPAAQLDRTNLEFGPQVESEDSFYIGQFQYAVGNHFLGAAHPLFTGLEAEKDVPLKFGLLFEERRSTEQHRHMTVVAAGVHPIGNLGTVIASFRLLNR